MTQEPDSTRGLITIGIMLIIYFLPAIVAWTRGHHNGNAIFLANLLLGWTILGWIGSLIWSATAVEDKPKRLSGLQRWEGKKLEDESRFYGTPIPMDENPYKVGTRLAKEWDAQYEQSLEAPRK
jgi:hypothetical protein